MTKALIEGNYKKLNKEIKSLAANEYLEFLNEFEEKARPLVDAIKPTLVEAIKHGIIAGIFLFADKMIEENKDDLN